MYKIEKGISIDLLSTPRGRRLSAALLDFEKGDLTKINIHITDGSIGYVAETLRSMYKGYKYTGKISSALTFKIKRDENLIEVSKLDKSPRSVKERALKYPFREMEVGDSFFIPCEEAEMSRKTNSLSVAASRFSRNSGGETKFMVRTMPGDFEFEPGIRIWRVH